MLIAGLRSRVIASGVLVAAGLLIGCVVPLGPGFELHSRQMAFAGLPSQPVRLHVRISDRLENVGNRDLAYLDITLPAGLPPGKSNLSVSVDGRAAAATPVSEQSDAPLRIRFEPPWPPNETRAVVFEYDRGSEPAGSGFAAATADGLYLVDPSAFPRWLPPVGVFVKADLQDSDEQFELSVPSDFLVLAPGREQRQRRGATTLHRFRTSPSDFPSFVIAGPYREQRFTTPGGNVVFWTIGPLDGAAAQTTAERLATSAATFERVFGPPGNSGWPLRVVEAPGDVAPLDPNEAGISAVSFPLGVLLDRRAFAQGLASAPVLRLAEAMLARTWFGWRVPLRPDAELLLGQGMGLFGVALAAEAREGDAARRREIVRLVAGYDRARVRSEEPPMLGASAGYSTDQRSVASYKAALFLAALEDAAGREKFENAMRRIQSALVGRGLFLSADDLRSALEAAVGQNFADVFRAWLNRRGVPDDFRMRYAAASPAAASVAAAGAIKR